MKENFSKNDFGSDFLWGVSSSATQTEGAHDKDGKGMSIWDAFSARSNLIKNNDNHFTATDFYNSYEEDIALVKELGIPNFRFSLSWSRILPNGIGDVNASGIDFYHRVIDCCIRNKITPMVTLYHWDLPEELEKKGGWTNREIITWFEEYVKICVTAYKEKVKYWMVLNEPMVFTGCGYFLGIHAPGKKGLKNFIPAMHHAVLCQAVGYNTIKSIDSFAIVGTTFSCSYITPHSNSVKDHVAATRVDALINRLFIEPSLGLGYPLEELPFLKKVQHYSLLGDEHLMKVNFDFVGIQNYTREIVSHSMYVPYINAKIIPVEKRKVKTTAMNWEIYPKAIYEMISKFHEYEGVKKIIITENGAAFHDKIEGDVVNDSNRIEFLYSYLEQVLKAKQKFPKLSGYFVWSLTDNFEWSEGLEKRFGLVYIDYNSLKRTIKKSGLWYKDFLSKDVVDNSK